MFHRIGLRCLLNLRMGLRDLTSYLVKMLRVGKESKRGAPSNGCDGGRLMWLVVGARGRN